MSCYLKVPHGRHRMTFAEKLRLCGGLLLVFVPLLVFSMGLAYVLMCAAYRQPIPVSDLLR